MKKINYYVASSIDGYISGVDEDISGFVGSGNGVQKYLDDLQDFGTVIMGRKTYEFGYKYGLKPGEPAYPHMKNYIFSKTLTFENENENVEVKKIDINEVSNIMQTSKTDIYLCGGGVFAGWLLDNEFIDILKIKVNPLVLGQGVRIFGKSNKNFKLNLIANEVYEEGLLINTYEIKY